MVHARLRVSLVARGPDAVLSSVSYVVDVVELKSTPGVCRSVSVADGALMLAKLPGNVVAGFELVDWD